MTDSLTVTGVPVSPELPRGDASSASAPSSVADGATPERVPGKRAWKRTKVRMLLAEAAQPGAVLDAAGRARLLKLHGLRLHLKEREFNELLDGGDLRLLETDPGTGAVLAEVESRADIYEHAARKIDAASSLDDVLRLRRVHYLSQPGGRVRPPVNAIAAAVRFMPEDPTNHDFTRLLCGGTMAQILVVEHKERFGGSHRNTKGVAGANVEQLLARAPTDLRAYLERRGLGRIREVPPACAAQLLGCRSELVFGLGLLRLELSLRASGSRDVYQDMLLVKQISICIDGDDLSTLDGLDRFAVEYCLDKVRYPADPDTRRYDVGQFLLDAHIAIDREIRGAEPADAAILSRYLLPLPRMPREFASRIAKARRKQVDDGRKKRKDRAEPIGDGLPGARFLAGSRVAELSHDQRCCALAIAEAAKLDTTGPVEVSFSYAAPIYDEDGRRVPGLQRRHWIARNTNRINEMLFERTGECVDRRCLPGRDKHLGAYDTEWWLFYERSEGVDGAEPRDPWLKGAVDALALYAGRGLPPLLVKRQLEFLRANGLHSDLPSRLPGGFAWYGGSQAFRARRVVVELDLRPWPMTELTHGLLTAHAGTSVMTTSGARTHEYFQIVQDPSRFYRLENLPGGEIRYIFLAVPKNFHEAVPYVITRECAKALFALTSFASARWHDGGPLPITPPPRDLADKCAEGRFVNNAGSCPLRVNKFNPLVQLLFVGRHELEAYDLRHGFASYAAGTGIPIEIIAAWLNQKALDITRYYAKPSRKVRDQWWLQFHTSVDLQEFQAAGHAILDTEKQRALDNVGALTSVPGGTCVSLGECPVRFSCIGCRCNAADPEKRQEVVDSMAAATSLRDVWARNGRVKAVAEQENAIERHESMIREMDLITQYRKLRDEVVAPEMEVRPKPQAVVGRAA